MTIVIPLFLGLAAGSFLNVLALRYREGSRIFTADIIYGRSHCPYCQKNLRWHELIPLFSFIIQLGRCRHCHRQLSWQYPIVELLSGLAFVILPWVVEPAPLGILIVLTLMLITLIDLRLSVIPDQLNWFLVLLGLAPLFMSTFNYYLLVPKIGGALFGLGFFGLIILLSRGQGMGMGDLKMATALGFLFGWPSIAILVGLAFILGGVWAALILLLGKKSLKDTVPFGPFLAIASVLVLFLGNAIISKYWPYF